MELWQDMASYAIGVISVLIRISPEEIANQSGVWDVCWAHDALDLTSLDSPPGRGKLIAQHSAVASGKQNRTRHKHQRKVNHSNCLYDSTTTM